MDSKANPTSPAKESWWHLIRNLLIFLAIIGFFSFGAFIFAAPFGWLSQPESRLAVFLVGSIIGEWIAFVVLVWVIRRQRLYLRDLGWGQPTSVLGLSLALLITLVYSGITAANPQVGSHLLQWSPLKGLALIAALTAGIVEETIFRGYVINAVGRMKYRGYLQVLVSGFAFALAHVYGFSSPASYLISLIFTFFLGIGLAIVYLIGKKSLTPVILSHFLIDAVIEPWLLLSFFTGPGK